MTLTVKEYLQLKKLHALTLQLADCRARRKAAIRRAQAADMGGLCLLSCAVIMLSLMGWQLVML